jgi:outer membrane murein-binding lipoprotein Lpp
MNNIRLSSILLCVLLALIGCKKEEPPARDGATEHKIDELEQKIDEIDRRIDELKTDLKGENGEVEIKYKKELARLEEIRDSLHQDVIDLKDAGIRAWERARENVDAALDDANRAIHSLTEELRKDKETETKIKKSE